MNTYYEYLFSTAYMETAVSKLIETQAEKIRRFSRKELSTDSISELNGTLKEQLKKLEYLHLLLLNKTELMLDILNMQDGNEGAVPIHFTENYDSPRIAVTEYSENSDVFIFNSKGQGAVLNTHDPYSGGFAAFSTHVTVPDTSGKADSYLSYNVIKGSKTLDLLSSSKNMSVRFIPDTEYIYIRIEGGGSVIVKEHGSHDVLTECEYVFDIKKDRGSCDRIFFGINIMSPESRVALHESGEIAGKAIFSKCIKKYS